MLSLDDFYSKEMANICGGLAHWDAEFQEDHFPNFLSARFGSTCFVETMPCSEFFLSILYCNEEQRGEFREKLENLYLSIKSRLSFFEKVQELCKKIENFGIEQASCYTARSVASHVSLSQIEADNNEPIAAEFQTLCEQEFGFKFKNTNTVLSDMPEFDKD